VTFWFTEKLWSKLIPSRSQLETGGDVKLDGQEQVDLLRRVEKIAAAHGGGHPEPVDVPDAFADFNPLEDE
jgi:hypothetical protein